MGASNWHVYALTTNTKFTDECNQKQRKKKMKIIFTVLVQCHISIPPENV